MVGIQYNSFFAKIKNLLIFFQPKHQKKLLDSKEMASTLALNDNSGYLMLLSLLAIFSFLPTLYGLFLFNKSFSRTTAIGLFIVLTLFCIANLFLWKQHQVQHHTSVNLEYVPLIKSLLPVFIVMGVVSCIIIFILNKAKGNGKGKIAVLLGSFNILAMGWWVACYYLANSF